MLIEFTGENIINGRFTAQLNLFEVCQNCSYEFGCFQIVLKLTKPLKNEDHIWALKTNLCDRSLANPARVVSYFVLNNNKRNFIVNFSSVGFYPLERITFFPNFEIFNLWDEEKIEISKVIVKAEVRKKCLDSANH